MSVLCTHPAFTRNFFNRTISERILRSLNDMRASSVFDLGVYSNYTYALAASLDQFFIEYASRKALFHLHCLAQLIGDFEYPKNYYDLVRKVLRTPLAADSDPELSAELSKMLAEDLATDRAVTGRTILPIEPIYQEASANNSLPNRGDIIHALTAATGMRESGQGNAGVWLALLNSAGLQMDGWSAVLPQVYHNKTRCEPAFTIRQLFNVYQNEHKNYVFPPGYHIVAHLTKEIFTLRTADKSAASAAAEAPESPDSPDALDAIESPVSGDVEMLKPTVRPTQFIAENPAEPKEPSTHKRCGGDTPRLSPLVLKHYAYRKAIHYEKKGAQGSNKHAHLDAINETFGVLTVDFAISSDLSDSLIAQAQAIIDSKENLSSWSESTHQRIRFARTELATSYFCLYHALHSYNYAVELLNKASQGIKADAL
ncbi:hypothetical protein M413DRAFT_28260 [Hebeloma cylindrosporum]|uniref:Uncharacterized protein n=1 Tax=Hebeloma cylindrosporum TaxID=76867 RepID=A0A0C3C876_HEBCY|nr:hypothetical protein M413DRAFT_28260 [Hebeloma cylindrosporum h7]